MAKIKHHRIRFQERPMEKATVELEEELRGLKGVNKVNVDFEKGEVSVKYDLIKVSELDIEKKMVDLGFVLDSGLWERFKRGWVQFTEENEKDNLTAEHTSCCSDPTEKYGAKEQK